MSRLLSYINEASNPKYPRTYHLPWSEEIHSDDKTHRDVGNFLNKSLTITAKMDGSNVGISFDTVSSRSGMSPDHQSFDMLKQRYASIKHDIPKGFVIYGEWLYAVHSIEYNDLDDYLMAFAILDGNKWLSWSEVVEWCVLLGIHHVPVIKKSISFDNIDKMIKVTTKLAEKTIKSGHEGIVIRNSGSFTDFSTNTAKYVRRGHVQTDKHWAFRTIKVNRVK
jgi:hypothetical protein